MGTLEAHPIENTENNIFNNTVLLRSAPFHKNRQTILRTTQDKHIILTVSCFLSKMGSIGTITTTKQHYPKGTTIFLYATNPQYIPKQVPYHWTRLCKFLTFKSRGTRLLLRRFICKCTGRRKLST
jgi:hypothetical protein